MAADVLEQRIRFYFAKGYTQKNIVNALFVRDDIKICQRYLRKILAKLGLYRRRYSDLEEVVDFISNALDGSAQLHGYRFMHQRCIMAGLTVKTDIVREVLSFLDPVGVEFRKSRRLIRRRYYGRGPNFVWHMDSYDKLTPFGIGINGCIDGYSRNVIWAEAYSTNSDPAVIGAYYVNGVRAVGGCPYILRVDCGTENVIAVRLQEFFREDGNGQIPEHCVIAGTSTSNQRIESWWGQYRKGNGEFWLAHFHELQSAGHFTGTSFEKHLVRFCFLNIIQEELDSFTALWNRHAIRKTRNTFIRHGQPQLLFSLPALFDTQDYKCNVNNERIEAVIEANVCEEKGEYPCDPDVFELCMRIMVEGGMQQPQTAQEVIALFVHLREKAEEMDLL